MGYFYVPILVPLNTALALLLVMPTDCTLTPGAKISTAAPKFENEALVSVDASMAPTVMAEGAEAGEVELASICFMFRQKRPGSRRGKKGKYIFIPSRGNNHDARSRQRSNCTIQRRTLTPSNAHIQHRFPCQSSGCRVCGYEIQTLDYA
jgi:hypothetical protein